MKQDFLSKPKTAHLAFVCLMLAICLSGCASVQPSSTSNTPSTSAAVPSQTSVSPAPTCSVVEISPMVVPYYPPPDKLELCGEPVPLHDQEVLERFDKEFTLVVYNHAQVYLWLKRMERYFPWLEEQLRLNRLPDDLKYVAVAESDLLPNACSPKGAAGPWQFMPSTGCYYGLDQKGSSDKRYDFENASISAIRYLTDLNRKFRNWTLAIASYNCGEGRVQDEMRVQRVTNYYSMKLPQETERYIFRILAIKTILNNPSRYGYNLPKGQGYPPLKVDRTHVTVANPVPIQSAAAAAGTSYREFKRLNPALRADEIPPGTHEIKLPEGKAKDFEQNIESAKAQAPPTEVKPVEPKVKAPDKAPVAAKPQSRVASVTYHMVKSGETLTSIAQRYRVSAEQLRKENKLKSDKLTSGQKLVIP